MLKNTIIVRGNKIKRIAITCKCGKRFIETVPGEVLDGGAIPVFTCPDCAQQYVIRDGQLTRVPNLHEMMGLEEPDTLDTPVDAEFGGETQNKNAWQMPGSKLVN